MSRRKLKWLIPVVVMFIVLIGGVTGGVLAATNDSSSITEDQSQTTDQYQALLDRACAIYEEETGVAIDSEQLRDALKQARSEIQNEALESRLQNLVDEGTMTQEEADSYLEWWQSRPDIQLPLLGLGGHDLGGGMMRGDGFRSWGDPCSPDVFAEATG